MVWIFGKFLGFISWFFCDFMSWWCKFGYFEKCDFVEVIGFIECIVVVWYGIIFCVVLYIN